MALSRRDFLWTSSTVLASSWATGCASFQALGRGSRDPEVVLRESVEGRYAVALLADLQTRVLHVPTDPRIAFHRTYGAHATIKPVTYWAGLQQSLIRPDTPYACNGEHCGFGGHGPINAFEAVWRSCNGFFMELATKLDRPRWIELLHEVGYGQPTGLGSDDENPGVCPTIIESEEAARVLAAYGTGIEVTPVQNLVLAARFAIGGRSFPLNGKIMDRWPEAEDARVDLVRRAWRMHALKGQGAAVDTKAFPVGSRTGSARGSGWYLAFGPFEAPRYVLVVHVASPPAEPGSPLREAEKIAASIFRRLA